LAARRIMQPDVTEAERDRLRIAIREHKIIIHDNNVERAKK